MKYTTVLDRIIIGFACALLIMSVFLPMTAASGNHIRIEIKNELQYRGALFEERTLRFQGALSTVQVETGPSGVRVSQSTCRNQVCTGQGWQKSNGAVIVCVPNNLVIFISSHQEQQLGPLDTTTR